MKMESRYTDVDENETTNNEWSLKAQTVIKLHLK